VRATRTSHRSLARSCSAPPHAAVFFLGVVASVASQKRELATLAARGERWVLRLRRG